MHAPSQQPQLAIVRFNAEQGIRHCRLVGIDPDDALVRVLHWSGDATKAENMAFDPVLIEKYQRRGCNAYLIPGGSRVDAGVRSMPTLFAEWDGLSEDDAVALVREKAPPPPTMWLRTRRGGSPHAWWRFAEPCTDIGRWKSVMRRFVAALGSDPACVNASRLMRLAGSSYYQKAGHPDEGEVLGQAEIFAECEGNTTTLDEIEDWLPPPPPAPPAWPRPAVELPPRPMEEVEAALAAIPRRVPGSNTYERYRRILCGLRHALERLCPGQGEAMAVVLMEGHSPSAECGWNIPQVLESSQWLDEGNFWKAARAAGWAPEPRGGPSAPVEVVTGPTEPYRILGWSEDRTQIWYQVRATGQTATLPRILGGPLLLLLAPKSYWDAVCGGKMNATEAADVVIREANAAGVFAEADQRGIGVWQDEGRTIWNRGDRLVVDGVEVGHLEVDSQYAYMRRAPLRLPERQPYDGRRIIDAIIALGWQHPAHALYLAGWSVLSPLSGSLTHRPGLVLTSRSASGKTVTFRQVALPLSGGTVWMQEGATTEAGVRQANADVARGIALDESEHDGRGVARQKMLALFRSAYTANGGTVKGTTHGKAMSFIARQMFTFIAVNFPMPNPADRNRCAFICRAHLPAADYRERAATLSGLLTPGVGSAVLQDSVARLPVLLANIQVFCRVVEALVPRPDAARWGETLGTLLAGAAWLDTGMVAMAEPQVLAWLDERGWEYEQLEPEEAEETEASTCLDHLLSRTVRWRSRESEASDERTILELYRQAAGIGDQYEATRALDRYGLRAMPGVGLFVANHCAATDRIFSGTKWADGGHRARLLEVEGAQITKNTWCAGQNRRGVTVPVPPEA